jgi:hypothetical protein
MVKPFEASFPHLFCVDNPDLPLGRRHKTMGGEEAYPEKSLPFE